MTEVEYKSELEYTKDTPYLALTGELWDAFCEDSEKLDRTVQCNRQAKNVILPGGHQWASPREVIATHLKIGYLIFKWLHPTLNKFHIISP